MKFDTKKCTPIKGSPEEAMIQPNKYILENDNVNEEMKTSTPGGREKKYMAALVYSEVLTSTRESEKKKTRRLLTTADVDDLSKHLDNLFVSCKDVGEDEKVASSNVKVITSKVKVEEGKDSAEEDVLLGRVAEQFYSPKSRMSKSVLRSARKVNK